MKKLILIGLFLALSTNLFALPGTRQYQATWNANTEADVEGYYLYWKSPSGEFTDENRVQTLTTVQLLTGVVPSPSEIAVTCYDTSGNESGFSDSVPFDKDSTAPAAPGGLIIEEIP